MWECIFLCVVSICVVTCQLQKVKTIADITTEAEKTKRIEYQWKIDSLKSIQK